MHEVLYVYTMKQKE